MTKRRVPRKPKSVWVAGTAVTPISAKERRKIDKRTRKLYDQLRERYPEVHGKVVDFVTHSIEDGTLYFGVRFTDTTEFSLRCGCEVFVAGVDFSDWTSGDGDIIREYMRPTRCKE